MLQLSTLKLLQWCGTDCVHSYQPHSMCRLILVYLGCYAFCRDTAVRGSPCIICTSLGFLDGNMRALFLSWGFLIFLLWVGKAFVAQGAKQRSYPCLHSLLSKPCILQMCLQESWTSFLQVGFPQDTDVSAKFSPGLLITPHFYQWLWGRLVLALYRLLQQGIGSRDRAT